MVTIIQNDKFEQCFEMVMSLWPQECKVRVNDIADTNEMVSRDSSSLYLDIYLDIYNEVLHHMEDEDRQLLHRVQHGVFEVVSTLCHTTSVKSVSRDCIVKQEVREVLNQSPHWQVV